MKTLQVGELKKRFSEVLDKVRNGEEIAVSYGKKKELVAVIVPISKYQKKNKRNIGILAGKAGFKASKDFKISEEEIFDL